MGVCPRNFGDVGASRLGLGLGLLKIRLSPTCVSLSYVIVNGVSVITQIRRKNLTPFKITRGHRNRHGSIGYL